MDAQGFVDGIGPMSALPTPLAKLGVGVLKSIPLRSSANQMSYFDKETFATDEAVTVGRLHCLQEGWSDALVNFMQSGGFSPSQLVPQVQVPSLVLVGTAGRYPGRHRVCTQVFGDLAECGAPMGRKQRSRTPFGTTRHNGGCHSRVCFDVERAGGRR